MDQYDHTGTPWVPLLYTPPYVHPYCTPSVHTAVPHVLEGRYTDEQVGLRVCADLPVVYRAVPTSVVPWYTDPMSIYKAFRTDYRTGSTGDLGVFTLRRPDVRTVNVTVYLPDRHLLTDRESLLYNKLQEPVQYGLVHRLDNTRTDNAGRYLTVGGRVRTPFCTV